MPELIDRQAALEKMCGDCKSGYDGHCPHPFGMCHEYESILQVPTIEAEPVRHGHWVLTRDEQYEYCHCSECGYDTGENWMIGSEIPYCAQCGSKNYDGGADNG